MNNSVFGKTMENVENHVDIKLVYGDDVHIATATEKSIKLVAKFNCNNTTIFNENLIAIQMKKTKVFYNKPIYLGMSILDLSKKFNV